jgi:hypothetical protein
MPHDHAYPLVDQTAFFSQASTRGRIPSNFSGAILRAGNFLALICLFFGASCAALIPASLEQRLGGLFFFGFAPAICFHAGGYILGVSRWELLAKSVHGLRRIFDLPKV